MDKTPDAYRTISEVADDIDLPQHVLRFWETRFGQIKPLKRAGGRRFYRPDDVDLLKGIRHLLYHEGYTIKGVQRILKDQGVRAILALVRNNGLEAEPEGALNQSAVAPVLSAPLIMQPEVTAPVFHQNHIQDDIFQQNPALQDIIRQEPPPLSIPPEWRTPLDLEAEFAAFHAQDAVEHQPIIQHAKSPQDAPHILPLPLPMPIVSPAQPSAAANPLLALPLSFGAPFQLPFATAPTPGRVSMVRGGIAAQQKSETHAAPPWVENTQSAVPTAPVMPMPAPPVKQKDHEAEEARAILTLALQELATCREMIEALHAPLRAAE